jgi:hypothetical protein
MIGTSGYTNCEDCRDVNECPELWLIKSCCKSLPQEIISIPAGTVSIGEIWIDTNDLCWELAEQVDQLPTNYSISLASQYFGECEACNTVNPCPEVVYVTIRNCCNPLQVEVYATQAFVPQTGTIFTDINGVCWEATSWDLTGTVSWPVPIYNSKQFDDCTQCRLDAGGCPDYYLFSACCETGVTQVAYGVFTIGLSYREAISNNCYVCVSITTDTPTSNFYTDTPYETCELCLESNPCNYYEVYNCCLDTNQVVLAQGGMGFSGFYDPLTGVCFDFVSSSTGPATVSVGTITAQYSDCTTCIAAHACPA